MCKFEDAPIFILIHLGEMIFDEYVLETLEIDIKMKLTGFRRNYRIA